MERGTVKALSGTKQSQPVKSISTSDAPVWMHILSQMVIVKNKDNKEIVIPLDDKTAILSNSKHKEGGETSIVDLYPEAD